MNVVCPRCTHRFPAPQAATTTCPGCKMLLDLEAHDTLDGVPATPVDRDLSGQVFAGYRVEHWLGSGGMGIVYAALTPNTDERVALKVLPPFLGGQSEAVERFQREAQTLRGLAHPEIVAYRDSGVWEGRHYIAMELLEGSSLEEALHQGPLPWPQVVSIGAAVARALLAAHAQGIVHRDLKPANIMLTPSGVKVLDFGIARLSLGELTLTHSDALLGTLNYMAPEQRTRGASVDHRADLFALGVVLYRCLTGQLPLGSFERPSALAAAVPRRLDRCVTKLLQRDPARRHASADEVRAELDSIGAPRRWPVALATAAAVLLAVSGGWWVRDRAPDPVAEAPTTPPQAQVAMESEVPQPQTQAPPEPQAQAKAAPEPAVTPQAPLPKPLPAKIDKPKVAPLPEGVPGFVRVVGVAAGDTLNIRSRPEAGAARIAGLAPGQRCVRYLGKRAMVDGAWWYLVSVPDDPLALAGSNGVRFAGAFKAPQGWVHGDFVARQDKTECGEGKRAPMPKKAAGKLEKSL